MLRRGGKKGDAGRIHIQVQQSSYGENNSTMKAGSEKESEKQSSGAEKDIFTAQESKDGSPSVSQEGIDAQFFGTSAEKEAVGIRHVEDDESHQEDRDRPAHGFHTPVRGNLLHDDIVHGEREKGKEHGDDESGGKQVQGVKGKIFPYIFQGYG